MFDLLAGNHHGVGWMTTGFAVFLLCMLPFTGGFFLFRFVRDIRAFVREKTPENRRDLSDRIFGWSIILFIHTGAIFLAIHRTVTTR